MIIRLCVLCLHWCSAFCVAEGWAQGEIFVPISKEEPTRWMRRRKPHFLHRRQQRVDGRPRPLQQDYTITLCPSTPGTRSRSTSCRLTFRRTPTPTTTTCSWPTTATALQQTSSALGRLRSWGSASPPRLTTPTGCRDDFSFRVNNNATGGDVGWVAALRDAMFLPRGWHFVGEPCAISRQSDQCRGVS